MIVLLCGPSGSGKTTLLSGFAERTQSRIVQTVVSRTNARLGNECGRTEVPRHEFDRCRARFQYLYSYDDTVYGCSLQQDDILSAEYVFLDYPGEYPSCVELNGVNWRGILVLPPDRCELVRRLMRLNKGHRIPSAIDEYDEICMELERGEYARPKWRVFYSTSHASLDALTKDVAQKRLFPTV